MDVYESEQALQKLSAAERTRLPLISSENKNGVSPLAQTREVRSRCRSPLPSSPTKRCSSPTASRTSSTSTFSAAAKRAISAERNRPSRPSSPRSPSTPIQDTTAELLLSSRKVAGNKIPESLWPSTMRSLNVSFQSDTYSVPNSKKEKPASYMPDRTLRQSSNVAHRQAEAPASGKPTPERKQSPLTGRNSADQSENSKPVDSLYPRMVDQHRWPSTTAGKVSTALNRSIDLADKKNKVTPTPSLRRLDRITVSSKSIDLADKKSKTSPSPRSETGTPSRRRLSPDGTAVLTRSMDLADKTSKNSSISRSETGSPSLRRQSLDGAVGPDRSIDLADKTSKPSSLSAGSPSLRRLSLDGNAMLNRSIDLPDKKSKTSLSPHLERGTSSLKRLSPNGNAVPSRSIDLADKTSRTSSSFHPETNTPSIRRMSVDGSPVPNRSIDLVGRISKTSSSSRTETGTPSPRVLSLGGKSKPLVKSTSDLLVSCDESGRSLANGCSVDDCSPEIARPDSSSSSDRTQMSNTASKHFGILPVLSTVSRWISPSRSKAVNSSRGHSPARIRPSSPTRKLQSAASVLSFITDIRQGKKAANHIENVHNLRLLYNRLLQWRYANAQSDDALQSQKLKAEKVLCSVWMEIAALWDSIMEKRIEIQQVKLKLKLYSILDNQICGLEEWASTETNHHSSLTWAIEDLQSSTVRVPVIRGARGNIQTIKEAVCAAVDVMQAMGSSLCCVLLKVDRMNCLVSELADVVIEGRALFDEYESMLISIAELQVEEYSLRSHLMQMKQAWSNDELSIYGD
ncbi:AUGMIN subunit 8-like [Salvia miltiorrhiza]|uniref:AUGMIN subunit 8-like n=1 Tax=Salvia miltiorrhiza TaxID=226208 RepID=UPI0025AC17B3|nr:AUGMIN subunit 8-like [Salvia miltiorrhiza]XP_057767201.1 AUGMIN subunit 8-like [Salvia miltiorrhiza]